MHFSIKTNTFGDVTQMAAIYFGLPRKLIFLSNKIDGGVIYMADQSIQDILFPLRTATRAGVTFYLYVILQRKMSDTDLLNDNLSLKNEAAEAVNEVAEIENLNSKKEQEADDTKRQYELRETIKR